MRGKRAKELRKLAAATYKVNPRYTFLNYLRRLKDQFTGGSYVGAGRIRSAGL